MSAENPIELRMLTLINDARASRGLTPLKMISQLCNAARNHTTWMLETNQFSHSGQNGSSLTDRIETAGYLFTGASLALENIGWQTASDQGLMDDIADVHALLMDSLSDRSNILNSKAEDIGIGIQTGTFSGANGDFEAVMVTQVFGRTDADLNISDTEKNPKVDTDVNSLPESADDNSDEPIFSDDDDWPNVSETSASHTPDLLLDLTLEEDVVQAPKTLSFDLSELFKFNRDGDQIIVETSKEKLSAALQSAVDDWVFMTEGATQDDTDDDGISGVMFEENDADDLALRYVP